MATTSALYAWLSHPLLLLITGAVISSYLIPMLTRRWQNHQKELELKIVLVSSISEAFTDFLMSIQFAEVGAKSQTQEDFDKAYRDWEKVKAKIASQLRAYFPKTPIGHDWEALAELVSDFYALTGIHDKNHRTGHLNKMQQTGLVQHNSINWNELASKSNRTIYSTSWASLKQQMVHKKDELVQLILQSRISSF